MNEAFSSTPPPFLPAKQKPEGDDYLGLNEPKWTLICKKAGQAPRLGESNCMIGVTGPRQSSAIPDRYQLIKTPELSDLSQTKENGTAWGSNLIICGEGFVHIWGFFASSRFGEAGHGESLLLCPFKY